MHVKVDQMIEKEIVPGVSAINNAGGGRIRTDNRAFTTIRFHYPRATSPGPNAAA